MNRERKSNCWNLLCDVGVVNSTAWRKYSLDNHKDRHPNQTEAQQEKYKNVSGCWSDWKSTSGAAAGPNDTIVRCPPPNNRNGKRGRSKSKSRSRSPERKRSPSPPRKTSKEKREEQERAQREAERAAEQKRKEDEAAAAEREKFWKEHDKQAEQNYEAYISERMSPSDKAAAAELGLTHKQFHDLPELTTTDFDNVPDLETKGDKHVFVLNAVIDKMMQHIAQYSAASRRELLSVMARYYKKFNSKDKDLNWVGSKFRASEWALRERLKGVLAIEEYFANHVRPGLLREEEQEWAHGERAAWESHLAQSAAELEKSNVIRNRAQSKFDQLCPSEAKRGPQLTKNACTDFIAGYDRKTPFQYNPTVDKWSANKQWYHTRNALGIACQCGPLTVQRLFQHREANPKFERKKKVPAKSKKEK